MVKEKCTCQCHAAENFGFDKSSCVHCKNIKLGLIAFANDGGLGAQTRRLAKMLNPDRILVIDSSGFSRNKEQHLEWYKDYDYFTCNGFPNNTDVQKFLPNLTHVLTAENPYNFGIVWWGQKQGTKILCQSNYEFCDNLQQPWLPVPDKFLMPSYWKLQEMEERFGKDRVMYLPPPIDPSEFEKARSVNLKRKGKKRFLHIIGTAAMTDRNGTLDLIDSISLAKSDFELVIKSQHPLSMDVFLDDPRVKYELNNVPVISDLYEGFDALLLPRRWGGLSLTTNEALMSGMPVLMTDISPNNSLLPEKWLVPAVLKGRFPARLPVEFYSVDHQKYAQKIDEVANMSDEQMFQERFLAFDIGVNSFSEKVLKPKYLQLFANG